MNNGARRISISLEGWQRFLSPADLRRQDIEWLGLVRRGDGQAGALGRIVATGTLVQVNAGVARTLDQRKAEAALAGARRQLQDQGQAGA
ncbi:MAG: hypothetical protein Q4D91_00995 [Lautropia sp.]|nr:hypothetical protein [Lautropia sp.]